MPWSAGDFGVSLPYLLDGRIVSLRGCCAMRASRTGGILRGRSFQLKNRLTSRSERLMGGVIGDEDFGATVVCG